jgi:hypothetical protein
VASLAKVTEALRHAGRQVRLIEIGEPRRIVLASCTVECPLCPGKSRAAGVGIVTGRMPVRFHNEAFGEQSRRPVPEGSGLGGSGKVDGLTWAGQVESLMGLGSEDLRSQRRVIGVARIRQCLRKVPLGNAVFVAVVGDPAGQLRQLATCGIT